MVETGRPSSDHLPGLALVKMRRPPSPTKQSLQQFLRTGGAQPAVISRGEGQDRCGRSLGGRSVIFTGEGARPPGRLLSTCARLWVLFSVRLKV